jgi:hypothetical protein
MTPAVSSEVRPCLQSRAPRRMATSTAHAARWIASSECNEPNSASRTSLSDEVICASELSMTKSAPTMTQTGSACESTSRETSRMKKLRTRRIKGAVKPAIGVLFC